MPYQVALTVRAPILPGQVPQVKRILDEIGVESERRRLLPFEQLPLHFARMFVLDDARDLEGADIPATLVLLSDVDAPLDGCVRRLCRVAAEGLDRAFSCCTGYPDHPTAASRASYLTSHTLRSSARYVNTVGRSVAQVHEEARLRDAICGYLDEHGAEWRQMTAGEIWADVSEHIAADPGLSWALEAAAAPPVPWRIRGWMTAAVAVAVVVVLLPLIVVALPFYLVALRLHELRDKTVRQIASPAQVASLEAREDWITQNQFTAVGVRKPGPLRAFTLGAILVVLDLTCRFYFNRGSLAGIQTIHFARWVSIDDDRRLLFASNYDGSLESYMDDFIDKVAFGLNAVFSNGVGYPQTKWLLFEGAKDEQAFKDLLRARQVETPVWYSAYPDLTTVNIANNAAIRAGLTRHLSSVEAAAWLARL